MRRIICFLRDHRWVKRQYPNDDSGAGAGYYLHCRYCGKDNHDTGQLQGHLGSTMLGGGFG